MKPSIFDYQHLHLKDYLFKLFPAGKLNGNEFLIGNIQGDAGESLSFNIDKGCGGDFADKLVFKNIAELVAAKFGLSIQEAFQQIEDDWGVKDNVVAIKPKEQKKKKEFKQAPFDKSKALNIPRFFTEKYGDPTGRWLYENAQGEGIGWIVRFDTPEGKQYYPFVWGDDNAWHSKAFDKPRPLYNLPELLHTKNIIYIVEGEKDAENARQLFPSLTVTTWPGGAQAVDYSDWTPLQGKKVIVGRDNDKPGEKCQKKIAEIALDLGCVVRVFKDDAFDDREKGWSVPDLLESQEFEGRQVEEWVKQNITEYQRGGADSTGSTLDGDDKSAQVSEEPINKHYRTLGMLGNRFLIYNYHSGRLEEKTADGFTEAYCRALVCNSTDYWKSLLKVPPKGKIHWKSIPGVLSKDFYHLGQFDTDRIRGLGCWKDKDRIVFNAGNYLFVDGKKISIRDFESYYVYIRSEDILSSLDNELDAVELDQFLEICYMFAWEYPACGTLLAGWLMVAPICGSLRWRPHIYITGESGSGKSTIFDNILGRTLGNCTTAALGDSTKAGLAQSGKIDALPIIFDEMENNSKIDEQRIDNVIQMARHSSSAQKGKSLKGRADQSGAEEYTCRSAFCFSSVTPSVKYYQDYTRITMLPLRIDKKITQQMSLAHFDKMVERIRALMGSDPQSNQFSEKFVTHAAHCVNSIEASYFILKPLAQTTLQGFTSRIADQIGMLLAGYWAYKSKEPITRDEALKLLRSYDWTDLIPSKRQENQMVLVSKLMQHKVYLTNDDSQKKYTRTVASLIDYLNYEGTTEHPDATYFSKPFVKGILLDMGIRLDKEREGYFVAFSNVSQPLSLILQATTWANNWHGTLKVLDGAFSPKSPVWFGKAIGNQRCTMVPLDVLVSQEQE